MGHEELLHQISEYATAAVTPGAADSYGKSFKAVANHRLKSRTTWAFARVKAADVLWKFTHESAAQPLDQRPMQFCKR